jgi:hypothetical protein
MEPLINRALFSLPLQGMDQWFHRISFQAPPLPLTHSPKYNFTRLFCFGNTFEKEIENEGDFS